CAAWDDSLSGYIC
nr:immunoglobulin light chain junction region [Macaca mulatta]MPO07143.1 immunoglobulin light chain junction region [Macaca mulatta]MPO09625.1 immunoglobulin light chain junction region [Macaca mulatta]